MRRVGLSRKGRGLVQRAQREAWPAIEAAVAQACAGLKGNLLRQLAALEDAATGYENFRNNQDEWTKVVLKPGMAKEAAEERGEAAHA